MTNPTADAAKLLPCPFCGSNAVSVSKGVARCDQCCLRGATYSTDRQAANKWNTRPQPAPPEGEPDRDHKLLARQIRNIAVAYKTINPTGELPDELNQIADEIDRLGLAARPKVEDAEYATQEDVERALLREHELRVAAEAKLAEREAELAKADVVIADKFKHFGPIDRNFLPLDAFKAIERHAARQQQKASAEPTEREGE